MSHDNLVDVAVKHIIARSTKKFFGCGPAGRVTTAIQGDLVVFAAHFTGPGILSALPQHTFGRLTMRYIADLYSQEVAPDLARLAEEQFGAKLKAVLSDLDFETGQSLGIAVLERPLFPSDRPANSGLSRAVIDALINAKEAIPYSLSESDRTPWMSADDANQEHVVVHVGPSALVLRAPAST